jgi:hypothetical protein
VTVDQNNWGVTLKDITVPLVKTRSLKDVSILACIGLNKIHVTYHGNKDEEMRQDSSNHEENQRAPRSRSSKSNSESSDSPPRKPLEKELLKGSVFITLERRLGLLVAPGGPTKILRCPVPESPIWLPTPMKTRLSIHPVVQLPTTTEV